MSNEFTLATIAEVDCTVESEVCGKYGVGGYPTLKFFMDGKVHDYDGAREKNAIALWIESMTRPALVYSTLDEIK